jgi:hypothetical protein
MGMDSMRPGLADMVVGEEAMVDAMAKDHDGINPNRQAKEENVSSSPPRAGIDE